MHTVCKLLCSNLKLRPTEAAEHRGRGQIAVLAGAAHQQCLLDVDQVQDTFMSILFNSAKTTAVNYNCLGKT
jgi:hypothetical protein